MSEAPLSRQPLDGRDLSLLSAYLDDELSDAERAEVEARLLQDASLQAELDALRQTVTAVRALPQVRPPRNFTLDPAQYGRRPAPRWLALATPMMASGATLLVVAACVGVLLVVGLPLGAARAPASEPLFSAESEVAGDVAEDAAAMERAEEAPEEFAIEAPAEEERVDEEMAAEAEEELLAEPLVEAEEMAPPAAPAEEAGAAGGEGVLEEAEETEESVDEGAADAVAGEALPEGDAVGEAGVAPPDIEAEPQAEAEARAEPTLVVGADVPQEQELVDGATNADAVAPEPPDAPAAVEPPTLPEATEVARPRRGSFVAGLGLGIAVVLGFGLLVAGLVITLSAYRR